MLGSMRLRFIQRFLDMAFGGQGYRALAYVVLAAFVAQGMVFSNHVHLAKSFSLADTQPSGGAAKKGPIERSDSTCSICNAAAGAGAFFGASAPRLRVPTLYSRAAAPGLSLAAVARFASPWQSRAPPSV